MAEYSHRAHLNPSGTASIAPSPSSLHPRRIVDASYVPGRSQTNYGSIKVEAVVHAAQHHDVGKGQDQPRALTRLPTVSLDVRASHDELDIVDAGHSGPVQINIDQLAPLVSESDWDVLEELVHRLSRPGREEKKGPSETGLEGLIAKIGEEVVNLGTHSEAVEQKRIILIGMSKGCSTRIVVWSIITSSLSEQHSTNAISVLIVAGLLPPALVAHLPSQQLQSSQLYQSYVNHVSSLSLHENVHLLLAPPVLSNVQPENAKPAGTWWTDGGELDRVVRMYGELS